MDNTLSQYYTMDLGDYLEVLRRRKLSFFLAFFVILIVGLVIAFVLPPVYRSEATIIIERQEIPEELVATTITGFVQERIEGIKQSIMTYSNLAEIEKQLDVYPEMRAAGQISEMVTLIRRNISVAMIDVKARGTATATIAFTVGYEADTAETAQKVAAALADRYLKENKQARTEQAAEVSEFLGAEAERLKKEIVELEKALASFKQDKLSELPELMQVNMRLFEKAEGQIESTRDRILKLEEAKQALVSELSLTDPRKAVADKEGNIIQTPDERLSGLLAEFLQSSARYTSSHPDIVRLRREIKILGGQSDQAAEVNRLVSSLTRQRNELMEKKQKYAENHPDIQSLEKSIAKVEGRLRNIDITVSSSNRVSKIPPNNPRYVALKTQLDATVSNIKEEKSKLRQYTAKLAEYEKRLFQTPVVERDYKSLSRDYANAQRKYAELKDKQIQARLAVQLEAGEKGERFVLAGNAYLPSSPISPNRLGLALLSGLLAMLGGVGTAALGEFRDHSVRGRKGIVKLFGALPIAVIPYIENTSDVSRRLKRRLLVVAIMVLVIAVMTVSYFLYVKSVDEASSIAQSYMFPLQG